MRLDVSGALQARQAEEDEGAGDEKREVAERGRDAELTGDEATEAAALKRLAVQHVDVVERVGRKADEQRRRERSAGSRGAPPQKQPRGQKFGGNDGNGRRPDEGRGDEVGEVRGEVAERKELRARREKEESREAEAADLNEDSESRATFHFSLSRSENPTATDGARNYDAQ